MDSYFQLSCFCGLLWSLWKILLILLFQTGFIHCGMFKANICITKGTQFGRVPNLKKFYSKRASVYGFTEIFAKSRSLCHHYCIVTYWRRFYQILSSLFFLKVSIAPFTEVRFKQYNFMDSRTSGFTASFHLSLTQGSFHRVPL